MRKFTRSNHFERQFASLHIHNIPKQEDADISENSHPSRKVRKNKIPIRAQIQFSGRVRSPRKDRRGHSANRKIVRYSR